MFGSGSSSIPGFGQQARFGQNTNSVNRNPFAPASNTAAATPAGNPLALRTPAGNSTCSNPFSLGGSVGSSSPFQTSIGAGLLPGNAANGNTFGTGSVFGQRIDTNKGNNPFSFGGSSSNSSPFSTSSGTSSWRSTSFAPSSSSAFAFGPSPGNGASKSSTVAPLSSERSMFFGQTIAASSSKNAFGITSGPQTKAAKYALMKDQLDPDKIWKNLISISAMPCMNKSHEELRFEDYQLSVDKGSKSIATLSPAASTGSGSQGNVTSTTSSFSFQTQSQGLSTVSPTTKPWGIFTSGGAIPSSIFQSQPQGFSTFSVTSQSQPHSSSTISAGTEAQFKSLSSTFSPFTSQTKPNVSSTTSTATGSQSAMYTSISSGFTYQTQPQAIPSIFPTPFQKVTSSVESNPHSQPQTLSPFSAGPWNNFPSTGTSLIQTASPIVSSWTKPEQIVAPLTTQTTPANYVITNKTSEQQPSGNLKSETHNPSTGMPQNTISVPTSAVANPFGERKSTHSQISSISVPCGISSISNSGNPTPVKRISMLSARNLTLGRSKLSFEKYKPKEDGQKIPFYESKSAAGLGKAATSITPRQNPRAWVLNPLEEGNLETRSTTLPLVEEKSSEIETGNSNDSGKAKHGSCTSAKCKLSNEIALDTSAADGNLDSLTNKTAEVLPPNKYAAGVEAMIPKMQSPGYYTIPPIQELAARERVEPGFCSHVKDFVVGRKNYGSIKFLGETDIRNLDLESLIKFKYREVIVYADEDKKPQVGKGLNKPAEITLLNVKCIDKDTGKQYVDGPKVDRGRNMLIKKAADQGVEFVSYDPVQGEWKFRVQHF